MMMLRLKSASLGGLDWLEIEVAAVGTREGLCVVDEVVWEWGTLCERSIVDC